MSIYIKGMEMPKDCPMCPMAHYNKLDEFTGCEVVPGRKYAVRKDADYANSSTRPDWCPLVSVPPHGDLIDRTSLLMDIIHSCVFSGKNGARTEIAGAQKVRNRISAAPIVIPADGGADNDRT